MQRRIQRILGIGLASAGLLAGGVAVAPPATADATQPTITGVTATPAQIVFDSASKAVNVQVTTDEPGGWRLDRAEYRACATTFYWQACLPVAQWLALDTTTVNLQNRTTTFSGAIPNSTGGARNRRVLEEIEFTYTAPDGESHVISTMRELYGVGDTQITLDGPSRIDPGTSLDLSGTVSCYAADGWGPGTAYSDYDDVTVEFRQDGKAAWSSLGGATYDRSTGRFSYTLLSLGATGDWRVRYNDYYGQCQSTTSPILHVRAGSAEPPPAPPQASAPGLSIAGTTDKTVSVGWSAPTNPNGTISGYRWGWEDDGGHSWSGLYKATAKPFVLTSLLSSTRYNIWVQAVTENGPGKRADIAATTAAAPVSVPVPPPAIVAPSKPRKLKATKSSTRVTLNWAAPALTGGAKVTGYRVARTGVAKLLKSSARTYTFTGLKPLRSYTFSVRAINAVGSSTPATLKVKTSAPAPRAYRTCAALNKVYVHGVGKKGAKDKAKGAKVANFYVSAKTYALNDGRVRSKKQYDLDTDNDGIACEKR